MKVDSSVARQKARRGPGNKAPPAAVLLGALAWAALQAGCGQKGPLSLPAPASASTGAAPAAAAASAAAR